MSILRCPNCSKRNHIQSIEKVTVVYGVIGVTNKGELIYDGMGGEVNYDTAAPSTDFARHPLLRCDACGHEWYEQSVTV